MEKLCIYVVINGAITGFYNKKNTIPGARDITTRLITPHTQENLVDDHAGKDYH